MGKDKLDLNNLLAKYESSNNFYKKTPTQQSNKRMQIDEQFYGKRTNTTSNFNLGNQQNPSNYRTLQHNININNVDNTIHQQEKYKATNTYVGNFQMSKQECRDFLQKMKFTLENQRGHIHEYPAKVLEQIRRKFQQDNRELKAQISQAIDQAFNQNYKKIEQELFQQINKSPLEFESVNKSIKDIENQINGFINMLSNNNTYRQAISKVVLKDYTHTVEVIRENIRSAKGEYVHALGEVEPDRSRLECLKNDLSKLFYFKRKEAKVIQKSIFSVLGGASNNSPAKQYNMNDCRFEPNQQQASRTRKPFFNFGGF